MSDRVPYRVAAEAARRALRTGRLLGCGLEELAALQAVVSLTALYSKLGDDVSLAQVAEQAALHPRNASRALASLAAKQVIDYVPGRGRGNLSWVALPAGKVASDATYSENGKGGRFTQEKMASPRGRVTSSSEKTSEKRVRAGDISPSSTSATAAERAMAERIIDEFNAECGSRYTAKAYLAVLVPIIRDYPDVTLDQHRECIQTTVWEDWVETRTPNLVYGSASAFENAYHRAFRDDGLQAVES